MWNHESLAAITTPGGSDTTGNDGPTRPLSGDGPHRLGDLLIGRTAGRFGLSAHSPQLRPCRY